MSSEDVKGWGNGPLEVLSYLSSGEKALISMSKYGILNHFRTEQSG
jgi:hypothetical protein